MTESEFFERFDRHLSRIDAHIVVANEHMARGNEHMARGNELMREIRESNEQTRLFLRDLLRRNERVMSGVVAELAEHRDQIRANTQAVLAMLDRFGPQPG